MKVAIGDAKAAVVDDSQKAYQVHIGNSFPHILLSKVKSHQRLIRQ